MVLLYYVVIRLEMNGAEGVLMKKKRKGFMKRFVKCKDWIIWLTHHILPNPLIQYKKPEWFKPNQVLAVNASDLVEKAQ